MLHPTPRMRRYFDEAYDIERCLPTDHTETAFQWQFAAIAILMPLLLAGLMWLGTSMPPSAGDAMSVMLVVGVILLYFLSKLVWAYRVHQFARKLPPAALSAS